MPGGALAGLLEGDSPAAAAFYGLATVTLLRRHELDAAVAGLMVVTAHERRHPAAAFLISDKLTARVVTAVLTKPRDCVFSVLNSETEFWFSFDTRGLEKDLSTPCSSS